MKRRHFRITARLVAACALLAGFGGLHAQDESRQSPHNVVQLSATGSVEVAQDWLSISMNTTREGQDAGVVQSQLKAALEAALAEAKKVAQPGQLELRTGNFSLYARAGRDGKLTGWQGSAELILEGRDFAAISASVGRIKALTVGAVTMGLSREQRSKVENEAQGIAIERFKSRATDIARSFGFAGYVLREVSINAGEPGFTPRPRMMAMEVRSASAEAPLPVEAGKTAVLVTVTGSVQMR